MTKFKATVVLGPLLLTQPLSSFAADDGTNNMFGVWGSATLQGDFTALSPSLNKFNWLIVDQSRTREHSPSGSRYSEKMPANWSDGIPQHLKSVAFAQRLCVARVPDLVFFSP